jgi:hypothetical protein
MNRACLQKQYGTTMLLTLVFLVGLVGAIALATDSGHVLVNKTRLQNALDAAALSAAISVNADPAKDTTKATTAGIATFDLFKGKPGNSELSKMSLKASDFQYSKYLTPFTAGTNPPSFVRVSTRASSGSTTLFPVAPILIKVLGVGSQNVSAESTAGAVGQNCSLVPFVMCAQVTPSLDKNCNDDTIRIDTSSGTPVTVLGSDGINDCYGYNIGQIRSLMIACNGNTSNCPANSLESGNFNLLNLDGSQGGKDIRDTLQGTTNVCANAGNTLDTKPGWTWGNVSKGIDDRFDSDTQTTKYPATDKPNNKGNAITYNPSPYNQYMASTSPLGNGRRNVAVPIGDCTGLQKGTSTIPKVGTACVFLTDHSINSGSDKYIMTEFTGASCEQNGIWNPKDSVLNGPYKIVIFHTEKSEDS